MARYKPLPPLEELNRLFELRDGVLYRKVNTSSAKAGEIAGTLTDSGYLRVKVNSVTYSVHRFIYYMYYGIDPKELQVDHINGITSDNRPDNLRLATCSQNQMNRTKLDKKNTSGMRGVYWSNKLQKWRTRVEHNNKNLSFGSFSNKQDAESAVIQARAELFGEFAGCST